MKPTAPCPRPHTPVHTSLLGLEGELLEGVGVAASPAFESWLVVERHRIAAVVEARLRHAALGLLAGGRAGAAVAYASRAVARNPREEGNHELLVRCLAAADTSAGAPAGLPVSGRAAVASQLDAGRAAIAAGAVQAGIDSLRRAVADPDACGTRPCRGRPWPPWAARWSTPSGAATRRARWSCTRPSAWPPWPGTGRRRSPPTGSRGPSRCRPAGARPPRPGWPGPRRWPTPTPSSPRSLGCGA